MAQAVENPEPRVPAALRTDTLADSVLILLGLTVVQRLVGFCRAMLFCRWLDPEQLGRWDLAFSFLMLAAPLSVLSLSGSFGRYVEHFRRRRQLRALLRRTALLCACLALPAGGLLYAGRRGFSQLIFGTSEHFQLVALLAAALLAVVAMHYLIDLFNALRNARLIAGLQFFHSLAFATTGICLLWLWRCDAHSVVAAYGVACVVCMVGGLCWLWRRRGAFPQDAAPASQRELWSKVLPFVGWLLLSSVLANLFEIADRYMIVHFSPMPPDEALACVGDYHSARVVPVLLVSITLMLSKMITPHLSHDWEAGRRERVVERLNLLLKLFGFSLAAAAVAVLFAAPLLFGVALRGKFPGGLAVLPWSLTYCCWFALAMVAQNYLWCAEKARLSSLALLVGLIVNVGLNLLLLPRLGLLGAVLATTAANLVALVLICTFTRIWGFRLDRGTRVALALPLSVCLGPWLAVLVLATVALEAIGSDRLLSHQEKRRLADRFLDYLGRLRGLLPVGKSAPGSP